MVSLRKLVTVKLQRLASTEEGTFGTLRTPVRSYFTLELPDRNNLPNISCIPIGTYVCSWTLSPRFKRKTYEIMKVKARSGIRIHSANFAGNDEKGFRKQLNGCLALGLKTGTLDGQKALLLSSPAIRQFETEMNGESFILEIS